MQDGINFSMEKTMIVMISLGAGFKKNSTHLLTVLTKSYITYITNEKQISLRVSKEVCIKNSESIFQKEGIYHVKTKYLSGRLC